MFRALRHHAAALPASLSELIFLAGVVPGAVMLALLGGEPGLLLGGVAGWAGAWLLAGLAGSGAVHGVLALNPLLSGLAVGHLVALGWDLPLLAAGAGAVTLAVSVALTPLLRQFGQLPILSLPFSLVATALWLAIPRWNALPAALSGQGLFSTLGADLPAPLHGFLTSLGALVFLPLPLVGACLAALLAWRSRILLVLAVIGWAVNALFHAWLRGDAGWAASDGFNAMLVAMAVGGVFLVPSWRSLLLAMGAAAGCAALGDALSGWWAGAGVPVFTIPFCVVVCMALRVLAASGSPLLVTAPGSIPEDTLAGHWAWRARFPGSLRSLAPPFAGTWTVWQGEDGRWTHQGAWRHALDFVIVGADGETHRGDGSRVEDYHAYGQPVLAPVSGQVVAVVDGVPDAAPGHPDQERRWGNLVVIHDQRGFWVELSHLACRSVTVAPGAWVERGQILGQCGNSGGAATLPFSLASWYGDGCFHSNELPGDGVAVEALPLDPSLETSARLLLGQRLVFDAWRDGAACARVELLVGLGEDGGTVLSSPRGRLHVGRHEGTFYAYRVEGDDAWLRLLLVALPRLPLAWRQGLGWSDAVPVTSAGRGWREMLSAFLGLLIPSLAVLRTRHRFVSRERIDGELLAAPLVPGRRTSVTLTSDGWIAEAACGGLRLRRISARAVVEPNRAAA